jgi:hypothetical protein
MNHPASEIEPPLHSARERPDGIMRAIAKPDSFENFDAPGFCQSSSQPMNASEDLQILKCA